MDFATLIDPTMPEVLEAFAERTRRSVKPRGGRKEGLATSAVEGALPAILAMINEAGDQATLAAAGENFSMGPVFNAAQMAITGGMPMAVRGALGSAGGRMAAMPKPIGSFDDVRRLLNENDNVFVRWSASGKHDMTPGARSRDYASGNEHAGLSALGLDRDASNDQLFRFLRDYGYLRSAGNERAVPRLYSGRRVGKDSDGADSIIPDRHLGTLSDDFVRFLDDEINRVRMTLAEDIATGRAALAYYEKNPPKYIPTWTPERVAEMEAKLAELGGPVKMPGK